MNHKRSKLQRKNEANTKETKRKVIKLRIKNSSHANRKLYTSIKEHDREKIGEGTKMGSEQTRTRTHMMYWRRLEKQREGDNQNGNKTLEQGGLISGDIMFEDQHRQRDEPGQCLSETHKKASHNEVKRVTPARKERGSWESWR